MRSRRTRWAPCRCTRIRVRNACHALGAHARVLDPGRDPEPERRRVLYSARHARGCEGITLQCRNGAVAAKASRDTGDRLPCVRGERGKELDDEMPPTSYELCEANRVQWIDGRFIVDWSEYMFLHYSFVVLPPRPLGTGAAACVRNQLRRVLGRESRRR
jgi:hypothetical protein